MAKNKAAQELARRRAKKLGKERTAEIATAAAQARWAGKTPAEKLAGTAKASEARRKSAKPSP